MGKFRKKVTIFAIGVGVLSLSSCALSDEERYQYVNQVKEDLDYKSTGEVIEERYDKNDGIVSPSYFYAELKGRETFNILSDRLQNLPQANCTYIGAEQTRCDVNGINVRITKAKESNELLDIKITDSSNGRR
jgi:hypothetical protein